MVNFNPGEIRGFHGRWILGGEHHKHVRNALRKMERGAAHEITPQEHRALTRHQIMSDRREMSRAAASEGRAAGISRSEMRQALAAYGMHQESLYARHKADQEARDSKRANELANRQKSIAAHHAKMDSIRKQREADRKKNERKRRAQNRRRSAGRGLGNAARGAGGAARLGLGLARLGMYLHYHHKAAAKAKAKKAKAAKKKAPPKRKVAIKKPKITKPPRQTPTRQTAIRAPAVHKAAAGAGARGRAVTAKPSAQVMANLSRYVATK